MVTLRSKQSQKRSSKRSTGTSIEKPQKRRKLSNDSPDESSDEPTSSSTIRSSSSHHSIISVRSLHFDHSDSDISEYQIKNIYEL